MRVPVSDVMTPYHNAITHHRGISDDAIGGTSQLDTIPRAITDGGIDDRTVGRTLKMDANSVVTGSCIDDAIDRILKVDAIVVVVGYGIDNKTTVGVSQVDAIIVVVTGCGINDRTVGRIPQ